MKLKKLINNFLKRMLKNKLFQIGENNLRYQKENMNQGREVLRGEIVYFLNNNYQIKKKKIINNTL